MGGEEFFQYRAIAFLAKNKVILANVRSASVGRISSTKPKRHTVIETGKGADQMVFNRATNSTQKPTMFGQVQKMCEKSPRAIPHRQQWEEHIGFIL